MEQKQRKRPNRKSEMKWSEVQEYVEDIENIESNEKMTPPSPVKLHKKRNILDVVMEEESQFDLDIDTSDLQITN